MITVYALYKFTRLDDFEKIQKPLKKFMELLDVRGTLLLAKEGINGTIAGEKINIDKVLVYLQSDKRLADIGYKYSYSEKPPFKRLKVKLKKEIVTLGISDIDPTHSSGTYVKPSDWNELINDPEVVLIDTRNNYEYEITYSLIPQYWRKGYALELAQHFRDYTKSTMPIQSVISMIHPNNAPSIKVAEKNAMILDGEHFIFGMTVLVYRYTF